MISDTLEQQYCKTYHAPTDADVLMTETAMKHTSQQVTALGNDTNLYVVFVVVFILYNIKLIFGLSTPKSRVQA